MWCRCRVEFCLSKPMECFHSRGQHLCKFIGTKESVCIRKEFNSHRINLGHQHGCRFIVLGHQYGRRDVMWKHSIAFLTSSLPLPSSMLSSLISAIFQRSTFMSVHNVSQIKAKGMAYLNRLHGSLCSERAFLHWKWWSFNITIKAHDGNSVIWKQITNMWMREGSLYCHLLRS